MIKYFEGENCLKTKYFNFTKDFLNMQLFKKFINSLNVEL